MGGGVHSDNSARPLHSDETSEQTDNTVGHHLHQDHTLLSGLHLDSERCGRAGVPKSRLLNHNLVVLNEDHDVLDVVLLLGQDGVGPTDTVGVPLGAVSSHQVVAVVQVVAGEELLTENKNRPVDSLVGLLVKGVDMSSVKDALAIQTFPRDCPVDLLIQVPENRSRQ